jgi:hypothetical protein
MVMEQVSFSFRQTVFGILKTLVVCAAGSNVDLTYDVNADIPDQLIGDFLRFQQVTKNLSKQCDQIHLPQRPRLTQLPSPRPRSLYCDIRGLRLGQRHWHRQTQAEPDL